MLLLLKMKTDYLDKLPWLFAALAHFDEHIAREFARKIRLAWEADPRPEAHHRITAELMMDKDFRENLDRFIAGTPRAQLSEAFRKKIAKWRFAAIVESTIEQKHARTSMARRAHAVGPVRVSLANRLPSLEQSLRSGHVDALALLRNFQKARRFNNLAGK
jgi:hypothetical protein